MGGRPVCPHRSFGAGKEDFLVSIAADAPAAERCNAFTSRDLPTLSARSGHRCRVALDSVRPAPYSITHLLSMICCGDTSGRPIPRGVAADRQSTTLERCHRRSRFRECCARARLTSSHFGRALRMARVGPQLLRDDGALKWSPLFNRRPSTESIPSRIVLTSEKSPPN